MPPSIAQYRTYILYISRPEGVYALPSWDPSTATCRPSSLDHTLLLSRDWERKNSRSRCKRACNYCTRLSRYPPSSHLKGMELTFTYRGPHVFPVPWPLANSFASLHGIRWYLPRIWLLSLDPEALLREHSAQCGKYNLIGYIMPTSYDVVNLLSMFHSSPRHLHCEDRRFVVFQTRPRAALGRTSSANIRGEREPSKVSSGLLYSCFPGASHNHVVGMVQINISGDLWLGFCYLWLF